MIPLTAIRSDSHEFLHVNDGRQTETVQQIARIQAENEGGTGELQPSAAYIWRHRDLSDLGTTT